MSGHDSEKPNDPNEIPQVVKDQFAERFGDIRGTRLDPEKLFVVTKGGLTTIRSYYRYFLRPADSYINEEYEVSSPALAIFREKAEGHFGRDGVRAIDIKDEGGNQSLDVSFSETDSVEATILWKYTENGHICLTYANGKLTSAMYVPTLPHSVGELPVPDQRHQIIFYRAEDVESSPEGLIYGDTNYVHPIEEIAKDSIRTKWDGNVVRAERFVSGEATDRFTLNEIVNIEEVKSKLVPIDLKKKPYDASCNVDINWTNEDAVLDAFGVDWEHLGEESSEKAAKMRANWMKMMKDIDRHAEEH